MHLANNNKIICQQETNNFSVCNTATISRSKKGHGDSSFNNLKVNPAKQTSKSWANSHSQSTCTHEGSRCACELLYWNMVGNISSIDSPCPSQPATCKINTWSGVTNLSSLHHSLEYFSPIRIITNTVVTMMDTKGLKGNN